MSKCHIVGNHNSRFKCAHRFLFLNPDRAVDMEKQKTDVNQYLIVHKIRRHYLPLNGF